MASFVQKLLVEPIVTNLQCSNYCVYCNGVIYHTEVYEETFDVKSKIAQNNFKKSLLTESRDYNLMANFGEYPGDFIL